MRACRFTHTSSITAEARCETTWTAPGTGQPGSATITLPRSSPAADVAYIDPDGGSLVLVNDEGGCGAWVGVTLAPAVTQDTITLQAVQDRAILQHRYVERSGLLSHVSPGYVVSEALRSSLGGVAAVHLAGDFDGDGPDIRSIEIDGRDAWSVLTEMMQTAGGDIHIDADGGIHWCDPLAFATRHDTPLVAGGNFHDVSVAADAGERVQEVIAVSGANRYTAQRPTGDLTAWPAQAAISVDSAGDLLVVAAHAELEQRNAAQIVIEGGVGQALWGIRERDYIRAHVSWGRLGGALARQCRVLSRSLSDDSPYMRLQLQVVQAVPGNVQTAGAGARQKPPQRPGRDGRGGSFAQRFRDNQRNVSRLIWQQWRG